MNNQTVNCMTCKKEFDVLVGFDLRAYRNELDNSDAQKQFFLRRPPRNFGQANFRRFWTLRK
jgi:hypothetical protein